MAHHKVTKDTKGEEGTAESHHRDTEAQRREEAGGAKNGNGSPQSHPFDRLPSAPLGTSRAS